MNKRLAAPLLAVSLALCVAMLFAAPAFGAVQGTAHDQAIGDQGTCSSCHIPHKALGARLWPQDMNTGSRVSDYGIVGSLCYYCHGSGGGAALPNAVQDFVMSAGTGDDLTHGRDTTTVPPGGNNVAASGLPYAGDTIFQCTTCHDVHDDADAPFLQADIDTLCATCHGDRQFVAGAASTTQAAWGGAFYGAANPGSHPVGTDIWGDSSDTGNSPIDMTAATDLHLAYGASEAHNLGGHLIDGVDVPGAAGAAVGCVTCHAVHGVQTDADPAAGGTAPVANLLAIAQPTAGGAFLGSVYNGNGDARNALCEGCHTNVLATIDSSTGLAYGGANEVNPGGTVGTHPVDDLGAAGSASVSAFPANWPTGNAPGTNVLPGPICESCHTPHPAANIARATILTASGTHILRGSEDGTSANYLCIQCHNFAEGAGHHPANVPMGNLGDSNIGNQDATLTCDDCHAAGSGAHNWAGAGVGLDPDWEPAGNARGPVADERNSLLTSKECEDCHYAEGGIAGPTDNVANTGNLVSHAWRTDSPGYEDIGDGTHFLGTNSMDYSLGEFGGGFDATTDNWTGQGQANARWSRFDGTGAESGHVVCESCHDIEADKNVPGTALLLAFYRDGEQSSVVADADPSGLCEGCHGTSPGGVAGSVAHPMTGDTVSRTGAALATTGSALIRPLAEIATESRATFPGDGEMNCDSCHQPHDADTDGGTYIYDSGEGMGPLASGALVHDVTNSGLGAPDGESLDGNYLGAGISALQDANFCDSCHFYTD